MRDGQIAPVRRLLSIDAVTNWGSRGHRSSLNSIDLTSAYKVSDPDTEFRIPPKARRMIFFLLQIINTQRLPW